MKQVNLATLVSFVSLLLSGEKAANPDLVNPLL